MTTRATVFTCESMLEWPGSFIKHFKTNSKTAFFPKWGFIAGSIKLYVLIYLSPLTPKPLEVWDLLSSYLFMPSLGRLPTIFLLYGWVT